jgi:hypothetical protein
MTSQDATILYTPTDDTVLAVAVEKLMRGVIAIRKAILCETNGDFQGRLTKESIEEAILDSRDESSFDEYTYDDDNRTMDYTTDYAEDDTVDDTAGYTTDYTVDYTAEDCTEASNEDTCVSSLGYGRYYRENSLRDYRPGLSNSINSKYGSNNNSVADSKYEKTVHRRNGRGGKKDGRLVENENRTDYESGCRTTEPVNKHDIAQVFDIVEIDTLLSQANLTDSCDESVESDGGSKATFIYDCRDVVRKRHIHGDISDEDSTPAAIKNWSNFHRSEKLRTLLTKKASMNSVPQLLPLSQSQLFQSNAGSPLEAPAVVESDNREKLLLESCELTNVTTGSSNKECKGRNWLLFRRSSKAEKRRVPSNSELQTTSKHYPLPRYNSYVASTKPKASNLTTMASLDMRSNLSKAGEVVHETGRRSRIEKLPTPTTVDRSELLESVYISRPSISGGGNTYKEQQIQKLESIAVDHPRTMKINVSIEPITPSNAKTTRKDSGKTTTTTETQCRVVPHTSSPVVEANRTIEDESYNKQFPENPPLSDPVCTIGTIIEETQQIELSKLGKVEGFEVHSFKLMRFEM